MNRRARPPSNRPMTPDDRPTEPPLPRLRLCTPAEIHGIYQGVPEARRRFDIAEAERAAHRGDLYVDASGELTLGAATVPSGAMVGRTLCRLVMVSRLGHVREVARELVFLAAGEVGESWAEEVARRAARHDPFADVREGQPEFLSLAQVGAAVARPTSPSAPAVRRLAHAVEALVALTFERAVAEARAAVRCD